MHEWHATDTKLCGKKAWSIPYGKRGKDTNTLLTLFFPNINITFYLLFYISSTLRIFAVLLFWLLFASHPIQAVYR